MKVKLMWVIDVHGFNTLKQKNPTSKEKEKIQKIVHYIHRDEPKPRMK